MNKKQIEIHRTIEVPEGRFCVNYREDPRVEMCTHLREKHEAIGWGDGLGSPGTISFYRCAAFDKGLYAPYTCGLVVDKCEACLSA